jgi:hypothetical protein
MIELWIVLMCLLYFTNIYNEQFALVSVPSQQAMQTRIWAQ